MPAEWEIGTSQFRPVTWVDANEGNDAIDLMFGTRIEGQGANLRIRLTKPQWENLKFLMDSTEPTGSAVLQCSARSVTQGSSSRARPASASTGSWTAARPSPVAPPLGGLVLNCRQVSVTQSSVRPAESDPRQYSQHFPRERQPPRRQARRAPTARQPQ